MNRFTEGSIDVHQHLWPRSLIDALRERRTPPRLRGWTLELVTEAPHHADPCDHDIDIRAAQARADGLDLALISLSGALGIEMLPPAESAELIDAYHEGVSDLPAPFGAWASASLTRIDAGELERRLDEGFVGLQLPARALLDHAGYLRAAPLLEVLEQRGAPLFVHPGSAASTIGAPAWWPWVVDYAAQMHAAWFALRAHGRAHHPGLRVAFAMLAGLAPLHGERFAARAGERTVVDELAFLEVSSYGTRAIDASVRVLGIDVIVHGSDRPYAAPLRPELGNAAVQALRRANPLRLLQRKELSNVDAAAAAAQP
jgi:predicted TIM-barrel fold metal-dependent hydrolase